MSAVTYYNLEVTVIATRPALPCFIPPNNCNRCGAELITSGAVLKHQAALEKRLEGYLDAALHEK